MFWLAIVLLDTIRAGSSDVSDLIMHILLHLWAFGIRFVYSSRERN
jgi:hypothetical protein